MILYITGTVAYRVALGGSSMWPRCLLAFAALWIMVCPVRAADAPLALPTARTNRQLEGWTVRVDNRLLQGPDRALGARALRFLENKLADIQVVVPADKLKKLQTVTIVLDLSHGKLGPMQYHPSAGWLQANGYSTELAKCVHIPRAADLATRRNINEQPWVILHELAHAYHDQVLGFDEPRIKEAYENYKKSGHGDRTLLFNGKRVKHYALTNQMEFFAEMTEAYFGVNDFFPFNRAELKESEPAIFALMRDVWETVPKHASTNGGKADQPVKVFILAGQSNMEGKAPNALLEHQATDAKTSGLFSHLRKEGKWIVRDDVFIKFLDRKGPLTVGYGSPGRTGVELEFGTVMGDHFQEPVLLIKAAWGGHALYKHFRSPSAGYPAAEVLQMELDRAQENIKKNNQKNKKNDPLPTLEDIKKTYGSSYRNVLAEVKDVTDNYATMFPALKGEKLELAGFVWFQGWNDQYGAQDEYESNMKHFIRDMRKDLHAPKLPFVIGVMGQNGSKPATGAMRTIQRAQLAMNDVPEFRGTVKAIRTDVLIDKTAEELYPAWRKNMEQWKLVGGDHGYHYLGSAIWFNRIGKAMGEAMVELLKETR